LTNKNFALIIIPSQFAEEKTKDSAPSGSFQHKLQHGCFYLQCLGPFRPISTTTTKEDEGKHSF